jgi:hypothetical protein
MSTDAASLELRWEAVRYRRLIPLTASGGAAGALYARLCAHVERTRDAHRRAVAVGRIERWLGVDPAAAERIYFDALCSEAREEADSCRLMAHEGRLPRVVATPGAEPVHAGPAIWATLHFGSPVLAYLYLRRVRGLDIQIVGRPLDDANPMSDAKRAWGRRKVEWLERQGGLPLLGVGPEATAIARTRLLRGGSICVLMDVPGDVVARSMTLALCGERVSLAAGIFLLAGMTGVPVLPVAVVRRGHTFEVHHGTPIEVAPGRVPKDDIARALARFLLSMPGEWWLWPYLPTAA